MGLAEFDWVILGDEPAGLWLARQLAATRGGDGLKLAWATFRPEDSEADLPEIPLPRLVADAYEIPVGEVWSPEIATPKRTLLWSRATLQEKFPALPFFSPPFHATPRDLVDSLLRPDAERLRQAGRAVRRNPELFGFSQGMLKLLGRSEKLSPDGSLVASLLATELTWWSPAAHLPSVVTRIPLSVSENPISRVNHSRVGLTLDFEGHGPILARNWVLNLPFSTFLSLSKRNVDLLRWLGLFGEMRSTRALFPLRIEVESPAVPCAVTPLTVWFDTEDIPEVDSETLPIVLKPGRDERGRERVLELWVSAMREVSLEATLEAMRLSMGKVRRLFPFLSRFTLSQSLPLDMETCFSDEARSSAMAQLEADRYEKYELAAFRTQTRHPGLWSLFPFLHCQLPYPAGPLEAARWLRDEVHLRKRGQKIETPGISTPPPSPPPTPKSLDRPL